MSATKDPAVSKEKVLGITRPGIKNDEVLDLYKTWSKEYDKDLDEEEYGGPRKVAQTLAAALGEGSAARVLDVAAALGEGSAARVLDVAAGLGEGSAARVLDVAAGLGEGSAARVLDVAAGLGEGSAARVLDVAAGLGEGSAARVLDVAAALGEGSAARVLDAAAGQGEGSAARVLDVAAALGEGSAARVLDVAAGTGLCGLELSKVGFSNVDALDASQEMLDVAKTKNVYKNFLKEFLGPNRLNIDDDTYDVVTGSGLFSNGHVKSDCLDELIRVVKPGGVVCLALREVLLRTSEDCKALEPRMAALQTKGRWEQIRRDVFPGYVIGFDGVLYLFKVT
ncbi:WBSCR27 [Branchiostoma lanceolatum]|uniref:WBSCR27 protein n=1 Tax=Branchiostoma lanceolatum TaxID=7740 RepID=A0A8K0ED37_BRALA|nr:WBSCR27 [Branchiostoma lanceolatum]